ncbi:unnamed protein product [marine sediment metagenome]|uniref:Uncharacterized protein n=1 Tax=marine sediment metagenome TaxID=412755 RepID=X1JNH6_9ZZZZ
MAKLKGPLFSLGATQQIAKTLVYFPWKGLNVVREYVVPTNPDTDLQKAQRAKLRTMVAAVHTTQARAAQPLNSVDQTAYSALASVKGFIMTWFNMVVKLGIDCLVDEKGYTIYCDGSVPFKGIADFRPRLVLEDDGVTRIADGKFYLGTTRTNLIHSEAAQVTTGVVVELTGTNGFSGLTAGTKYYWQFRPDEDDPCEGADSGIYSAVAE